MNQGQIYAVSPEDIARMALPEMDAIIDFARQSDPLLAAYYGPDLAALVGLIPGSFVVPVCTCPGDTLEE